jgi:tRNA-specific 2-thiouridylase
MNKKVMVGMSGGVDSSVAALLLKDAGYDVVGVTMCFSAVGASLPDGQASTLGGNTASRKRPSCCGIEGIEDAKKVAHQIGISHYVLNFGKALEEAVVLDFISEYISGRTPNPCVRCNQYLKFGEFLKKAKALGCDHVATGHFARIEKKAGAFILKKGADPKKDQSYFLCEVAPRRLSRILFPVGDMTKEEVRAIAKKRGLYVADKPASQEVCFIPDNDYRAFLKSRLNKAYFKKGDVVDTKGNVLGRHEGIFNFTLGQREGLRISAPHPLYVVGLSQKHNRVVVGKKEDVFSSSLIAVEPNIFVKGAIKRSTLVYAKIRYNHKAAKAKATLLSKGKLRVDFTQPQAAITSGQFVVLYKGDTVLCGAKII